MNYVRTALHYSTDSEILSTLQLVLGDIDVDGGVDAADAGAIMNMSVEL